MNCPLRFDLKRYGASWFQTIECASQVGARRSPGTFSTTQVGDDIGGELAQAYGYVNRALPDADLDGFVDALATRMAAFDKWAIANTKRLVNASLPPDVEIAAGWDACMASVARPATQARIKAFFELGFHKPGEAEDRLGAYLGRLGR
jgi:enoyl-CoA hydratase/carnithine racemase